MINTNSIALGQSGGTTNEAAVDKAIAVFNADADDDAVYVKRSADNGLHFVDVYEDGVLIEPGFRAWVFI